MEGTMTENEKEYFWVVLCKNRHFHYLQNRSTGHIILLGETDSVSPPPRLNAPFSVRCDNCGRQFFYQSKDILRFESDPPAVFEAHPLFADLESV
jgi:hypothetical protein